MSERTIGVLADTHGRLHPRVIPTFVEAGVSQILHAGDVGQEAILEELAAVAPLVAVRGNVDHGAWADELPLVAELSIAGYRLLMTHIAGQPDRPDPTVASLLAEKAADLFICGHTHRPLLARLERERLWLNPGASGRQGFHRHATIALVHLTAEGIRVELIDLGPKLGKRTLAAPRES